MQSVLRAGIIGLGNISKPHIAAIRSMPNARVTAVCDIDPDKRTRAARELGARETENWRKLAEDPNVDVVHVLTPHFLHAEMSVFALENGKHVLCEKPMAIDGQGAKSMLAAAHASEGSLGIVMQNRYNRSTEALKRIIQSGAAGRLLTVRAAVTWRRDKAYYSDAWHGRLATEGGGALINQAIHTVDLLSYLGGPIARVRGQVFTGMLEDAIEVEDNACASFVYRDGQPGVIHVSTNYGVDAPIFVEMAFERAVYQLVAEKLYKLEDGNPVLVVRGETVEGEKSYWGAGHKAQIHAFYEEIRAGRPHEIGGEAGFPSLQFVLAVYESSKSGRWVTLEPLQGAYPLR